MARESRALGRTVGSAAELPTFALVCEGEKTEDIYFNGIRKLHRLTTAHLHVVGLGADPLTVVAHAESIQADYDHTWAVFDIEASGPHATSHSNLDHAFARADRAGINCAISHPCFELWLILHYELQTANLNNRAARKKAEQLECDYDDKGFNFSKIWQHHQDAIANAVQLDTRQRKNIDRIVDRNPWTTVHQLVARMLDAIEEIESQRTRPAPSNVGPRPKR